MNEQRIRELAEQASTHAEETVHYYMGQFDGLMWEAEILKERDLKFAELIVKECANAIVNDSRLSDVRTARNGCVRAIKQHFGVEE